jgi:hypothetical protein
MAMTDAEVQRITSVEEAVNDLSTVVNNLAPKQELRQLQLLRQSEIDEIKQRLTSIESQLKILQQRLG